MQTPEVILIFFLCLFLLEQYCMSDLALKIRCFAPSAYSALQLYQAKSLLKSMDHFLLFILYIASKWISFLANLSQI